MTFAIRPYQESDLRDLYRICLLTGYNGEDARPHMRDHDLLGHIFAAPYGVLEPDLAFILTNNGVPCGYVLGARDSLAFAERCEREWFPALRERYSLPDPEDQSIEARFTRRIHDGIRLKENVAGYPAHLHIDLLPEGQGKGWGRKMMETFLHRLRAIGVPGVHLGVSATNIRAIGFYERMGFQRLHEYPDSMVYAMRLE